MTYHNAIFMGSIVRKVYDARDYYGLTLHESYETIEEKQICKVQLDNPPLIRGEYIYINEISKRVKIKETIRSTNNELIYYTDYYFEIIEDEITSKSKEQAENEIKEIEQNYLKEKLAKEEQEKLENKKWYQFWK